MKKLILPFTFVLLGLTGFAATTSAQVYEARVVGPRLTIRDGRGGGRLASDVERLNREVRRVREEIRALDGGRRVRAEFAQVVRATDQVNFRFRTGRYDRGEIRSRIDGLRADLERIQDRLRRRSGGSRFDR